MEATAMIKIVFDDEPIQAREDFTAYKDHFFNEPHDEPTTVKLTASFKNQLIQFAKDEGFTSLGPAIRELLLLGLKYYPLEAKFKADAQMVKYQHDPFVKKICEGKVF